MKLKTLERIAKIEQKLGISSGKRYRISVTNKSLNEYTGKAPFLTNVFLQTNEFRFHETTSTYISGGKLFHSCDEEIFGNKLKDNCFPEGSINYTLAREFIMFYLKNQEIIEDYIDSARETIINYSVPLVPIVISKLWDFPPEGQNIGV